MSLISPDFKEGKAILFIGMEGVGSKAKFYVTDEAIEFLGTVRFLGQDGSCKENGKDSWTTSMCPDAPLQS
jgi:hypothetical protein